MIQRGFSLVELIIATAISAFLVGALYQVIDQMQRNTTRIENTAAFIDTVILLENEFHHTFAGMVIPHIPLSFTSPNTPADLRSTGTIARDSVPKEEKKSDEPKVSPFFAEIFEGRLARCSCITTNALPVYGKSFVAPVRVSYYLEPMVEIPDRYRLMRQELRDYSAENTEEQKIAQSYELLDMITTISLRVVVVDPEKSEKKPVFVEQRPWSSADEKHRDILPEAVIIDCSWIHDGREYSHTVYAAVPAAGWYRERAAQEKERAQKAIPAQSSQGQSLQRGGA